MRSGTGGCGDRDAERDQSAGDAERDRRCGGCGAGPRRGGCCGFSLFPSFFLSPLGGPSPGALLVPPAQEETARSAPPRARPQTRPPGPSSPPHGGQGPVGTASPCLSRGRDAPCPGDDGDASSSSRRVGEEPPPSAEPPGVGAAWPWDGAPWGQTFFPLLGPRLEQRCPHGHPKPSPTSFVDTDDPHFCGEGNSATLKLLLPWTEQLENVTPVQPRILLPHFLAQF